MTFEDVINECADLERPRKVMWANIISRFQFENVAEIGVWRGEFAAYLLKECSSIRQYFMIDPWRHLDSWNKPANIESQAFEAVRAEAAERTKFAEHRVSVLRGTTSEVIDQIGDETLDFVYIDADHTLKGISIDLIRAYAKVKPGGLVGGDDFTTSIWQHSQQFEPSLVFPMAVYFAEAVQAVVIALPRNQFLIRKPLSGEEDFKFIDNTGQYRNLELRHQFLAVPNRNKITRLIPRFLRKRLKSIFNKNDVSRFD